MKTVFAAAALLATAGCAGMGMSGDQGARATDTTATGTMATDMTPTAAMPFMAMAAAGDLYEIESSRLALGKSQNADVRRFAQTMITDHTKTTATLKAQARAAGLTPPTPTLMPMQRDNIAKLRPLTGAAFDREYTMQQGASHQMALELNQGYAANGDTPALRTAASGAVPIIQNHIAMHHQLPGAM